MTATASSPGTATATARLLAQAELLREIRDRARAATLPVTARLTLLCIASRQSNELDPAQIGELARFFADASVVTQILDSGAADDAQRSAQARAAATLDREPDLAPAQRHGAINAAGALARMSRLAVALDTPAYEEQVRIHAARLRDYAARRAPLPVPDHTAVRAAAQARAAAAALADRQSQLRPAHLVRQRSRRIHIADLTERLVASARSPGHSGAPLRPPGDDELLA